MNKPLRAANRLLSRLAPFFIAMLAAIPATAQGDLKTKTVTISDLTDPHAPTPRLPFQTLLGLRNCERWISLVPVGRNYEFALDPDGLISAFAILDDSMNDDGVELQPSSGRLFMRGTAEQIQNWEDLISIARSHFSAPIKFEAAVIHHDGKMLPPSVLDPEQAQALLDGHKSSWSSAAASPSRIATYMGQHRAVSYLHTNEAHISEARWEASPQQDELFDGVGLVAVAHRLCEGDDLILQTQFAIGGLIEIGQHEAALGSQPDPQRPVLNVTAANMSGRIKNGGALVFNATAPKTLGGNVMVVVRASWTPVKQKTPDHIMFLPLSGLTANISSPPQFARIDHIDLAMPDDDNDDGNDGREPLITEGSINELIRCSIDPDAWDDTATMQSMNGHVMYRAKAEILKKVRKLITNQERQLLQTIEVVYTNGKGRITLPTLAHHGHGVRHGRETTAIAGLFTEMATKASIQVPQMVSLFEGIQFGITPYAANQLLGAQLNWTSRRIESKPEGTTLPPMQITSRNHTGSIPEGGLAMGKGPLGEENWALRRR